MKSQRNANNILSNSYRNSHGIVHGDIEIPKNYDAISMKFNDFLKLRFNDILIKCLACGHGYFKLIVLAQTLLLKSYVCHLTQLLCTNNGVTIESGDKGFKIDKKHRFISKYHPGRAG